MAAILSRPQCVKLLGCWHLVFLVLARGLNDLPAWPDHATHAWEEAEPKTLPAFHLRWLPTLPIWDTVFSISVAIWFGARLERLPFLASTSVYLSVRLSVSHTFLTMFSSSYHPEIFCIINIDRRDVHAKGQRHRGQSKFCPNMGISGPKLQFDFTDGYEIMHIAWSSIEEVPYCFSRSYVKFHGHRGQKNHRFLPELSDSGL